MVVIIQTKYYEIGEMDICSECRQTAVTKLREHMPSHLSDVFGVPVLTKFPGLLVGGSKVCDNCLSGE